MKKILYFCLLGLAILLLGGCTKKLDGYDEITIDELKEMVENKEDIILFIGSDQCSHCSTYKVTVNEIVKTYQIDIKYINIAKLDETGLQDLLKISNFGNSTPTTVFIKDGEEYCIDVEKIMEEKHYDQGGSKSLQIETVSGDINYSFTY